MKFWDNVGDPSCFPAPLSDCLPLADIRHYVSKSSKKTNKCKSFWPQFLREGRPQIFYGTLLA